MTRTIEYGDTTYPAKWDICGACDGEGASSAYLGAFTSNDLHDLGDEFIEDYFAGIYDRACEECGGTGKLLVPDESRLTDKLREQLYRDRLAYRECRAIEAAERRMGC